MPIYEYRCQECGQIFEEWQKNFEATEAQCPVCGTMSSRIMSNTSFVLKGTGWYVTDYCKKGETASQGSQTGAATPAEASQNAAGNGNGGNGNGDSAAKSADTAATAKDTTTAASGSAAPAASKSTKSAESATS